MYDTNDFFFGTQTFDLLFILDCFTVSGENQVSCFQSPFWSKTRRRELRRTLFCFRDIALYLFFNKSSLNIVCNDVHHERVCGLSIAYFIVCTTGWWKLFRIKEYENAQCKYRYSPQSFFKKINECDKCESCCMNSRSVKIMIG